MRLWFYTFLGIAIHFLIFFHDLWTVLIYEDLGGFYGVIHACKYFFGEGAYVFGIYAILIFANSLLYLSLYFSSKKRGKTIDEYIKTEDSGKGDFCLGIVFIISFLLFQGHLLTGIAVIVWLICGAFSALTGIGKN